MTSTPTTTTPTPPKPSPIDRQWRTAVIASFNVLFVILAVRAILLLAVIGAIWLAAAVVAAPDPWRLGALAIYTVGVIAPTIWLSSRR